MVSFKKYYYFAAIVVILMASLMVFRTFRNSEKLNIITTEVDVTNQWKRHLIGSNINRDHGLSVGVGDLNGDGKCDVLVAFGERNNPQSSDGVYWYKAPVNPRDSNWKRHRLSDTTFPIRWCMALSVGDMDNDQDLDVVALSFDNSNVYLCINPLSNDGEVDKPWQTIKIMDSPGVHRDGERVELVDIDNDGFKDVLFPRGRPPEVRVLFNPLGVLTDPWDNKFIGVHGGSDAHDVLCADIDIDGDMDIVTASGDQTWLGSVFWYEHPNRKPRDEDWRRHLISGGNFTKILLSLIPNSSFLSGLSKFTGYANFGGLQIDDIDKDGRPDVLVTEAHGIPGKVMWFQNPDPSNSGWRRFVIDKQNFPHAALSFDVDGDVINEYWVPDASHDETGKYGLRTGGIVYYKLVDAKSNQWGKYRVAIPPEVGRQCRAVDIDGDGDLDVVSTADHKSILHTISVVWWENITRHEKKSSI